MKLMQKTGQSMPDRGSQEGHLPCDAGLKVSPPWLLKLNHSRVDSVYCSRTYGHTISKLLTVYYCILHSVIYSALGKQPQTCSFPLLIMILEGSSIVYN